MGVMTDTSASSLSTADVFASPPPSFTEPQLADLAEMVFGLHGLMKPLNSERDQNVRMRTGQGDVVLKVANIAESKADLDLQCAALAHLAAVAPDLAVPRLIPTKSDDPLGSFMVGVDEHLVRCVSYVAGIPMAEVERTPDTFTQLGRFLGQLSAGLAGFGHPAAHRTGFLWNLDKAQACSAYLNDIVDDDDREVVAAALQLHAERVLPVLPSLRKAVIHQDANDYNVMVANDGSIGLIDFGDMTFGCQINELAVALAYALMGAFDVIATARLVVRGYVGEFPLLENETNVLFDLVAARLAMSVAISSHRSVGFPHNEYLLISQAPALRLLRKLASIRPDFLRAAAREAAGFSPIVNHNTIVTWLRSSRCQPKPVLGIDLERAGRFRVLLQKGAPGMEFGSDPEAYWAWLERRFASERATFALGGYLEDRNVYAGEQFVTDGTDRRSNHHGIDIFVAPNTPVQAMLDGRVVTVVDNDEAYDYGPTVILEHDAGGVPFWVLYGHLSRRTLTTVTPGQDVKAGDVIAFIGDHTVNGGWAPHLHVQIMTDLLGNHTGNFEGAGEPSRVAVWSSICPHPNLLLRLTPESFEIEPESSDELLRRRRDLLGASLSTSYRHKLTIVRGTGARLVDAGGRSYIDCVNNVCHVGHSHPHVVEALARQAAQLNTNTRYLHRSILDYADRLGGLFPDPLSVVYFVNSGSEANELAMRLARTATGRFDMVTLDWGYHGNTNDVIELSPYKFNRKGGTGKAPHIQIAELPDPYRGRFGSDAVAYAASVQECIQAARQHDQRGPAAFISESISGCGGQVFFPDGYLQFAYEHARAAGAVCIADEVQVGFGRVGDAMWAFEQQGVVPDIVTLGKPIGNGHPLGAVITTPAIAAAFNNGMEYFNTFGGNPVSCEVGMAVLDVIEQEGLQEHARVTGDQFLSGLRSLQARHPDIGDVRGRGLFLGIDLVVDRATKEPATKLASDVANALRAHGVLMSTDGPHDNVIKIKPPMPFTARDVDVVCTELDAALGNG
jgi:4-aminobutyrate aminotransferase-like enzyme/Ser/Thr protein kinase RdoA (MazF antagonist)